MSKATTIKVTAAPGRVVPVHPSTAAGQGNKQLRITDADVVELPNNIAVRRRINSGDLVVVTDAKKTNTKES